MSLLVVGLSHRSAPIPVLERAAVPAADAGKILDELLKCEPVAEVLALSTCNRVEVYAVVQSFHSGLTDITGVLARHCGIALDLRPHWPSVTRMPRWPTSPSPSKPTRRWLRCPG